MRTPNKSKNNTLDFFANNRYQINLGQDTSFKFKTKKKKK